jgi:hypothetical protein
MLTVFCIISENSVNDQPTGVYDIKRTEFYFYPYGRAPVLKDTTLQHTTGYEMLAMGLLSQNNGEEESCMKHVEGDSNIIAMGGWG